VANLITVNQEVVTTTEVIQGNIVADSGTPSTSATTGALVVRGGAGIGGDMYISGNIIPAANITYDLGSSTNWFRDLWLSSGTIHIGGARITQDPDTGAVAIVPRATAANPNPVATVFTSAGTIVTANTDKGTVSSANITSSTSSSNFSNLTANSATIANDVTIGGNLTIIGNLSVANAMLDRGAAGANWDSILLMGTYLVNRVSWSGTTGTPTDSMNYTGVLEVLNSGSTAFTQNYRPYDASTVAKNFWTRTKFSTNSWSSWVEVTNNTSQIDGGSF
jgi:hypothetical protein